MLLLDEIQTGLGRTGKTFAFEHELEAGVDGPDGLILGKALGGGLLPVSAFVATREVMAVFTPGSHGSTFGGNPLGCAVGLEALEILEAEKLAERSAALGDDLMLKLQAMNSPLVRDLRGCGLWVGVEIDPARAKARDVCVALMNRGILTKETHDTTIRLAPPLTITRDELAWAVSQIGEVLQDKVQLKA